jgi:hypothetical protein
VIGRNCVLDDDSIASESVIFPDTYVGEALELNGVIVHKNRLINEQNGSEITITDNFILSDIKEKQVGKWLSGVFSRAFASIILAFALPLLPFIYLSLMSKHPDLVIRKKKVVKLPAEYDQNLWKTYTINHIEFLEGSDSGDEMADNIPTVPQGNTRSHFLYKVLPGLVNVVLGNLQVIGVEPRSREEVLSLEPEWKLAYLKSKAGLITESYINFGPQASPDEVYSAEMLYSSSFTRKNDLVLLARYFNQLFREIFPVRKRQ